MCRLFDTLQFRDHLVQRLGEALFRSRSRRDRNQIRAILAHLHANGKPGAREILLRDLARTRLKDGHIERPYELLGVEGLEYMVQHQGRYKDFDLWMGYRQGIRLFGKRQTVKAFSKLPTPRREQVISWTNGYNPPVYPTTAKGWINRFESGEDIVPSRFEKVASADDWKTVARMILETSDEKMLRRGSRLMRDRAWPLDPEDALQNALREKGARSRSLKLQMLGSTKSAALRSWALSQISQGPENADFDIAFSVLAASATRGDGRLLTKRFAEIASDRERFHILTIGAFRLRNALTTEMLQLIYERVYCELCRGKAVRLLAKRGRLTKEQLEECAEDSDELTRKWARRRLAALKRFQ